MTKMHGVLTIVLLTLLGICIQPVIADDLEKSPGTLFLCIYDKSLQAKYAGGEAGCLQPGTALLAGTGDDTCLLASVRKLEGTSIPEGSNAREGQAVAYKGIGYKSAGNLSKDRGMVEMDVKPLFAEEKQDGNHYMFYSGSPDSLVSFSILVGKGTARLVISVTDKAAGVNQYGLVPVYNELLDGKRHRIAFTWDKEEIAVWADGVKLSRRTAPAVMPFGETFYIGGNGNKVSNNADSLVRSVRISGSAGGYDAGNKVSGALSSATASASPSPKAVAPVNLIRNPGFEKGLDGWKPTADTCRFVADTSVARAARQSLLLQKDDDLAVASLEATDFVPVEPGRRYRLRIYYHVSDLPEFNTANYQFVLEAKGLNDKGQVVSLGRTGTRTSIPIISLPGEWQENILWFTPGAGIVSAKPSVTLTGALRRIWIDDISLQIYDPSEDARPYNLSLPKPLYEWAQVTEMLKARKESSGKVVLKDGRGRLLVDGKETPPLFYKARGKMGYGCYSDFKDNGIKLFQMSINVSGTYTEIWTGKGKYDFDRLDKLIQLALQGSPDACLVPVFSIGPYPDWAEENPGSICLDQDGKPAMGRVEREYFGEPRQAGHKGIVTYYSLKLRQDIDGCLRDLLEHMKKQPYYKAIVGFGLTGGHDGMWRPHGQLFDHLIDYSPAAKDCFRDYMKRKYGSEANLRRSLNKPEITFASLQPPTIKERTNGTFRDLTRDRLSADYSEFLSVSLAEMLEGFGRTVKQNAGKDVFTTIYFTDYTGGMGRYMEGMRRMYASPWLDMFQTVAEYNPWRQPGAPGGVAPAFGSMAANGKIWLQEYDHRSWVSPAYNKEHDVQAGFRFLMTPEDFRRVLRRDTGEKIALGAGAYFYDLSGGYFHAPQMLKEMDFQERSYEKAIAGGMTGIKPQIAVITDDESCWWMAESNAGLSAMNNCLRQVVMSAGLSGVPYSVYSLNDLIEGKVPDCKVYLFANTFKLDEGERAFINGKLKNGGRTLIWVYASGYLDEKGMGSDRISKLTGIGISAPVTADAAARFVDKPGVALGNSPSAVGGAAMIRFTVEDSAARSLALYAGDKSVAAAVKDLAGWRSVFIGNPGLCTAGLLNGLARQAGAYVCTDSGIPVRVTDKFISIHGTRPGPVDIKLPRHCRKIIDAFDGRVLAENTDKIKLDLKLRETQWLILE
ncbi:MAG: hypothetical protein PHT33_08355 [bacterium]|nr:hypothetical protein [bacterium]